MAVRVVDRLPVRHYLDVPADGASVGLLVHQPGLERVTQDLRVVGVVVADLLLIR